MTAGVRVLVANLHATSRPFLVIPWLWLLAARLRVDVLVLQECTDRHARFLRRRSRRWVLVRRDGYGEAVYARRHLVDDPRIVGPITRTWRGHHTGDQHPGRTLPSCRVRGLRVYSVHMPPAWSDADHAPLDRVEAGLDYLTATRPIYAPRAGDPVRDPELWAGDWNARPQVARLARWRWAHHLQLDPLALDRIDHAATRGCEVTRSRRLRRGPGMDHRPLFLVVEP